MGKAIGKESRTWTEHCTKATFEYEVDAQRALKTIQMRAKLGQAKLPIPQAVYRCKRCGHWHLTKQIRKVYD